jgi:hypothetical protein
MAACFTAIGCLHASDVPVDNGAVFIWPPVVSSATRKGSARIPYAALISSLDVKRHLAVNARCARTESTASPILPTGNCRGSRRQSQALYRAPLRHPGFRYWRPARESGATKINSPKSRHGSARFANLHARTHLCRERSHPEPLSLSARSSPSGSRQLPKKALAQIPVTNLPPQSPQ